MFPILASVVLLVMFYLFDIATFFMFFSSALSSAAGITFAVYPLLEWGFPSLSRSSSQYAHPPPPTNPLLTYTSSLPCVGTVPRTVSVALGTSGVVILLWFVTGHWILNNSPSRLPTRNHIELTFFCFL